MKFILMMGMKTDKESQSKGIMTWPQGDIQAHIQFMMGFNKELKAAGELVSAEGLAWPDQAKLIRADKTARRSPMAYSPNRRSSSSATGSSTWRARSEHIRWRPALRPLPDWEERR
jgi:hypothetical protein